MPKMHFLSKMRRWVVQVLLVLVFSSSEGISFRLSPRCTHFISQMTLPAPKTMLNSWGTSFKRTLHRIEDISIHHSSRLWLRPKQGPIRSSHEENGDDSPHIPIVNISTKTVAIIIASVALMLVIPVSVQHNVGVNAISSVPASTTGDLFDPSRFQPVCGASDSLYFLLKNFANTIVGEHYFFILHYVYLNVIRPYICFVRLPFISYTVYFSLCSLPRA